MKTFRKLLQKPATIILDKNVLKIRSGDFEVMFVADGDYDIQFNTETLGGNYVLKDGKLILIGAKGCMFESGKEYIVNEILFYEDVQGETAVEYKDSFCSLYIELKIEAGRYCDITLEAEKIVVT